MVFNQKGGVGKSSITVNLAAISAKKGRHTLVVDLDAQCNATQYLLGQNTENDTPSIADFFEQFLSFRFTKKQPEAFLSLTPLPRLQLIKASPDLADLHSRLSAKHKIYKLRDALELLSPKFDAIFIDTPPAFNFYSLSALIASHSCLIPFDCDQFSRTALYSLLENIEEVKSDHNPSLFVEGIVVNQFLKRARLPQMLAGELEGEGLRVFKSRLSSSVKMRESHQSSKPLIHLAPRHGLTKEFLALFDELTRDH